MNIEDRARKRAAWFMEKASGIVADVILEGSAQTQQHDSVWILTREYSDSDTCLIQSVHHSQESAAKATEKHDLDPIYGLLTVSEWPVD